MSHCMQPTMYEFSCFKIEINNKADLYVPCTAMAHSTKWTRSSCENEGDFDKFSSRNLLKWKGKKLILVVYAKVQSEGGNGNGWVSGIILCLVPSTIELACKFSCFLSWKYYRKTCVLEGCQLFPKADIPVGKIIIWVILDKNQLNLMWLVHAMRSNGSLPQVVGHSQFHISWTSWWGWPCLQNPMDQFDW